MMSCSNIYEEAPQVALVLKNEGVVVISTRLVAKLNTEEVLRHTI